MRSASIEGKDGSVLDLNLNLNGFDLFNIKKTVKSRLFIIKNGQICRCYILSLGILGGD